MTTPATAPKWLYKPKPGGFGYSRTRVQGLAHASDTGLYLGPQVAGMEAAPEDRPAPKRKAESSMPERASLKVDTAHTIVGPTFG